MGSRREIGFARNILSRIAGIAYYAKSNSTEGDSFIVFLKRGTATNKALQIELRPDRLGQVQVVFLNIPIPFDPGMRRKAVTNQRGDATAPITQAGASSRWHS